MATKPTKLTDWATDGAALTTPTDTSRKTLGWQTLPDNLPGQTGERPNLNQQNFWQLAVHEWQQFFESVTDQLALSSSPAGIIQKYGGSSAPTGWLLCDGQAVSRTAFAELFAAIGTTFGIGDGSTTFNVPNGGPTINTEDNTNLSFWTFSGTWASPSALDMTERREGNRLISQAAFSTSGSSGSDLYIELPSGLTIDTAKITANASKLGLAGRIEDSTTDTPSIGGATSAAVLFWDGVTDNRLFFSTTTHNNSFQKDPFPNGSNRVWFEVDVPILEWAGQGIQIIKSFPDFT